MILPTVCMLYSIHNAIMDAVHTNTSCIMQKGR
jgi:hypothetical protein